MAAAIDLNRRGGLADRRYQISVSEGFVLGFFLWFGVEVFRLRTRLRRIGVLGFFVFVLRSYLARHIPAIAGRR